MDACLFVSPFFPSFFLLLSLSLTFFSLLFIVEDGCCSSLLFVYCPEITVCDIQDAESHLLIRVTKHKQNNNNKKNNKVDPQHSEAK